MIGRAHRCQPGQCSAFTCCSIEGLKSSCMFTNRYTSRTPTQQFIFLDPSISRLHISPHSPPPSPPTTSTTLFRYPTLSCTLPLFLLLSFHAFPSSPYIPESLPLSISSSVFLHPFHTPPQLSISPTLLFMSHGLFFQTPHNLYFPNPTSSSYPNLPSFLHTSLPLSLHLHL